MYMHMASSHNMYMHMASIVTTCTCTWLLYTVICETEYEGQKTDKYIPVVSVPDIRVRDIRARYRSPGDHPIPLSTQVAVIYRYTDNSLSVKSITIISNTPGVTSSACVAYISKPKLGGESI